MQPLENLIQRTQELSYTASATAAGLGSLTWLTENATAVGALCAIGGLLLAVCTFLVNWYYRHRANKRAENSLE